jgi:peptidoglycan/LPS O-acetylase OafA/YrhL
MSTTSSSYRPDIDGLRALAIVPVVLFHAFPSAIPGGFIGVDIFFVISGFLISRILIDEFHHQRFSLANFYARRIRRIFPALGLVLASCLAVGWCALTAEEYRLLGKHVVAGAAFMSNLVLASESGYFDTAAELKPLLNLWSLGVEEQFYIVWPLLLWLAFRRHWPLWVVLATLFVASFVACVLTTATRPDMAFYLPHTRFWELLAGAGLALASLRHRTLDGAPAEACSLTGLIMVCTGFAVLTHAHAFPGAWALLPVGGAALMIAGGPGTWIGRHVLGNPMMVFIGLISYPLYLWHWPALVLLRLATPGEPSAGQLWMTIALSVALAWLTYRLLEQPLRRLSTGTLGTLRIDPKVVAPALCVMLAASAGLWIRHAGGYPQRVPAEIVALTNMQYDSRESFRRDRCHLNDHQLPDAFRPECTTPGAPDGPVVMLWGDSHAGHLYAGLRDAAKARGFTLVQHTFSGCPPLPGYSPKNAPLCATGNDWVVERIRQSPPDILIVAGYWQIYNDYGDIAAKGRGLLDLAATLQRSGKSKIFVVGPVPEWNPTLPRTILNLSREGGVMISQARASNVPDRTLAGVNLRAFAQDSVLRETFAGSDIVYLSATDALCTDAGCLTLTNRTTPALSVFDATHLTESGSNFLISRFIPRLLGD